MVWTLQIAEARVHKGRQRTQGHRRFGCCGRKRKLQYKLHLFIKHLVRGKLWSGVQVRDQGIPLFETVQRRQTNGFQRSHG